MITTWIFYLIATCNLVWFIAFLGFFHSSNFLISFISLEIMFICNITTISSFSFLYSDMNGQIFALFIIAIAAIESALILALFITVSKLPRNTSNKF